MDDYSAPTDAYTKSNAFDEVLLQLRFFLANIRDSVVIDFTGHNTILQLLHEFCLEVEQESVDRFLFLTQKSVGNECTE